MNNNISPEEHGRLVEAARRRVKSLETDLANAKNQYRSNPGNWKEVIPEVEEDLRIAKQELRKFEQFLPAPAPNSSTSPGAQPNVVQVPARPDGTVPAKPPALAPDTTSTVPIISTGDVKCPNCEYVNSMQEVSGIYNPNTGRYEDGWICSECSHVVFNE